VELFFDDTADGIIPGSVLPFGHLFGLVFSFTSSQLLIERYGICDGFDDPNFRI